MGKIAVKLSLYQVDAFAERVFQGNPAAVIVVEAFPPDALMQAIAGEMNLSETAFVCHKGDHYSIRWFTPSTEVDLCGHATLASAHVLWNHLKVSAAELRFDSRSGWLSTRRQGSAISLNFPAQPTEPVNCPENIDSLIGGPQPLAAYAHEDLMLVYADADQLLTLRPDFTAMAKLAYRGVIVTAPSSDPELDFCCRFFAPASGIDEDPVTGSAFTKLAPYYAAQLGKVEFKARQLSQRGGDVGVKLENDRVLISGSAVTVMHATLFLPDN